MHLFRLLFSTTLFFLTSVAVAQDATVIMDGLVSKMKKYKSIKTTYTVSYEENGTVHSENGAIVLQGNKYVNKLNGTMTWFNGKTMWAYVVDNEEVTITNPTDEEIASSNPYNMISSYKKEYFPSLLSSTTSHYIIKLTPKSKSGEINHIQLKINKSSYQPVQMLIELTKSRMSIDLKSFETNHSYKSSSFTFNKSKYPNAEIVDLR